MKFLKVFFKLLLATFALIIFVIYLKNTPNKNRSFYPPTSRISSEVNPSKGKTLYERGNYSKGVLSCASCHGLDGRGNAESGFPKLAGQHARYTQKQLLAFKQQFRRNDEGRVMQIICAKLTENDIAILADYLASLSP